MRCAAPRVRRLGLTSRATPMSVRCATARLRCWSTAGRGAVLVPLEMLRRGLARFERLWLRWTGPLGLMWQQATVSLEAAFPILPDLRPVHERGAAIFQRHAFEGLIAQMIRGEGSDF